MRIALVVVLGGDLVRSTEHVGIGSIAAYLRSFNYEVHIFEVKDVEDTFDYQKLLEGDFNIIGFTTTCVTMKYILQLAKKIKDKNNNTYVVCGGHMATFGGIQILEKYNQIDFILLGEGEITFFELIKSIEDKSKFSNVKGLMYRRNGEIIINEKRKLISNLDLLPFPARDQFEQHNNKFQYLRISTSRGCLGNCGFCSSFVGRGSDGPRWRGRSPKNVVDEIEQIVNKYNFHTFDFVDSTFEDPGQEGKTRIKQIAEEIVNRNLKIFYNCCFRAENWREEDHGLLELLVKSGLEKVNIGFESGNNKGLKILNKRATTEDNWRAIKTLARFSDIYITFGFIMIHPFSTMQDVFDNAKFLYDTGIGQVIRHYFWQLEIYPGTLIERKLMEDKLLKKDYNIEEGMYKYRFENPEIENFALKCQEFLKITSVWDFEIFDIIIHTFITRLRRKYYKSPVMEKIEELSKYVNRERKEIAEFNFEFYMRFLKHYNNNSYKVSEEMLFLDKFILEKMDEIRSKQLKIGTDLLRTGIKLVKR